MLDPRRLAVLREFAAQGTIARAAEALSFTPSAVSQQLSLLQREAGVELFRKAGRRLELTDTGRALVAFAEQLLEQVERVEAELAAFAGDVRGTVRIAGFQTAALALVGPALDRLARDHPQLTVEFIELEAEAALPELVRGACDVVVADEYEHAPRPRQRQVRRRYAEPDPMLVALPPDHPAAAGDEPVPLASLSDSTWASARDGTAYADMFARLCRSVGGFEPDVRHRVNDLRLLLEFVARGSVALVPALGDPSSDTRVAVRPIAEGSFSREIFVAIRDSDSERPATAAVLAALGVPR